MQRISIDFKEPLQTASHNVYLFVIVDEYSRFQYLYFPWRETNLHCHELPELIFSNSGMPDYLH